MIKFSIIIPCKKKTNYLNECLKAINKQSINDFEVIVLPDEKEKIAGVKVIPLKSGPADKRDLGVKKAKGKYIAFIDDDAYPDSDWLKNSLKYFKKYDAVGGPQVTPNNDSFFQKTSGYALASRMTGGLRARYVPINHSFMINDWPTVNFLIKKSVFNKVGGFDSRYYPGEDTKLCLDVIKNGYKMVYAPDVIVYHHRRKGLMAYLRQVSNYGLHRGYFVKHFPETSFKLTYFIPSLFLIFFLSGLISFLFNDFIFRTFLILIFFYFSYAFIDILLLSGSFIHSLITPFYILLTHLFYGANFIKGLFTKRLLK